MGKATRYHHGDLRPALLTAGAALLAEMGVEAFSLRELAKRTGVSHNAPYQHFADKMTFLAALATQGFEQLAQALRTSLSPLADVPAPLRLQKAGAAYVEFLTAHPAYAAVMFGAVPHDPYPALAQSATQTLEMLVQIIADGQQMGTIRGGEALEMAGVIWAALHGLSVIVIARKLPARVLGNRPPAALAEQFVRLIYEGVR